jgi:PAS domain S-box-containing protein
MTMASPIRILHLEDDPADGDLIAATIAADGIVCELTRVDSGAAFIRAIDQPWDLVLCDYAIPGFDGVSAQAIVRARRLDLPFVFVSGTMGEEIAIERLKAGATDYVLKQRLGRLPSAVRRALEESEARRARRTLEDTVQFLEHLIAASPSMILRFEPDRLSATFVSPNVGSLLGYSPAEIVGSPGFWAGIIHPDDRAGVLADLRDATMAVRAQVEREYRLRGKDGHYRWFFTLLRIDYDAEGHPVSILAYALDIAARKAAEDEVQRANAFLDSVVEHVPAMLFVKDARDLRFMRFNRAAEEMLQISRTALIGRTDADVFAPTLADAHIAADRATLDGRAVVDIPEEIVASPVGGYRILHTRRIPICDPAGEPLYLLGISEDITERKMAQEAARLSRLEAEKASRAKSEFLSRMSHDLRTPLNAILGFAQLLEMDPLTADQTDSVTQILRGGRHLLELINEVLDIARIEAGHLSLALEPVSVAEAVQHVVGFIRPLAVARHVSIATDVSEPCPAYVLADRQRLNQVLLNLVDNAVKYNRDKGTVLVSGAVVGGRVRISIRDTGAGIPEDKRARLFQPFERLGAEQSPIEGTGLGLAVCKGLMEAMNGAIGVESETDIGSTFWIDVPEAVTPAPVLIEEVQSAAGSGTATSGVVLYVEDNRSNVRLLERLLGRRPGTTLIVAASGEDALHMARLQQPDLILLDLHLPDMSGEDVLRELRASAATRGIPVAIVTADATNHQASRLLAGGAVAYLTKPLQLRGLLTLLDEQLPALR